MQEQRDDEPIHKYIRIYEIHHNKQCQTNTSLGIRAQKKIPDIKWTTVWRNINMKFLPQYVRTIWYVITHDILPTNSRLYKIKLHENGKCKCCDQYDTITHRCTACKETQPIWKWTQQHIASYLRINARDVKDTWICCPDFELRPIQKHNATVWMLGHMLGYVQNNQTLTMEDYLDFLKRARWKEYTQRHKYKRCGK
jgi:hypothetical protein